MSELKGYIEATKIEPKLEDITITPSKVEQNFKSKVDGYDKIRVNAIPCKTLNIVPKQENQVFEGMYDKVNVDGISAEILNITPKKESQFFGGLYEKIYVDEIERDNITITPTETAQSFNGLYENVNVRAIETEEVTIVPDFSTQDTFEVTATEGKYITKASVNKPVNLVPEIILEGNSIYGVTGRVKPGTDTSDATATAEDIKIGKTAYVNGEKIEGTLGGYKFLEYIESDGTQYINTEYDPSTNSQFELDFSEFNGVGCLFGAYHGDWSKGIGLLTDTTGDYTFWFHHYGNYNSNIPCSKSGSVLINKNVLTINNKTFTATAKTSSYGFPIFLFGANWNGTFTSGVPMRIHKFVIKENNIVLHYYKPVINISTGEIGMYDVVDGKFFGNAGTGTFIAGNLIA